jgi:hypothetical protein
VVSHSSAEAEYRDVVNATSLLQECCWLRHLLQELHVNVHKATVIYCNNVSTMYLSHDPIHHRRTKHVEIDIHFVRKLVALSELCVVHVPTDLQYADIMTKDLPQVIFDKFRSSLHVGDATAHTARGGGGGLRSACTSLLF